jgi:hypothetical protein
VISLISIDWSHQEAHMKEAYVINDKVKDAWPKIPGRMLRHWPMLTEGDVRSPTGDVEYLAGRLQERYGLDRREAILQVYEFECEL